MKPPKSVNTGKSFLPLFQKVLSPDTRDPIRKLGWTQYLFAPQRDVDERGRSAPVCSRSSRQPLLPLSPGNESADRSATYNFFR